MGVCYGACSVAGRTAFCRRSCDVPTSANELQSELELCRLAYVCCIAGHPNGAMAPSVKAKAIRPWHRT